jgi:hypothetical protein
MISALYRSIRIFGDQDRFNQNGLGCIFRHEAEARTAFVSLNGHGTSNSPNEHRQPGMYKPNRFDCRLRLDSRVVLADGLHECIVVRCVWFGDIRILAFA